jgi:hypothetical protein
MLYLLVVKIKGFPGSNESVKDDSSYRILCHRRFDNVNKISQISEPMADIKLKGVKMSGKFG